jgi:hypothetical protein
VAGQLMSQRAVPLDMVTLYFQFHEFHSPPAVSWFLHEKGRASLKPALQLAALAGGTGSWSDVRMQRCRRRQAESDPARGPAAVRVATSCRAPRRWFNTSGMLKAMAMLRAGAFVGGRPWRPGHRWAPTWGTWRSRRCIRTAPAARSCTGPGRAVSGGSPLSGCGDGCSGGCDWACRSAGRRACRLCWVCWMRTCMSSKSGRSPTTSQLQQQNRVSTLLVSRQRITRRLRSVTIEPALFPPPGRHHLKLACRRAAAHLVGSKCSRLPQNPIQTLQGPSGHS